MGSLLRGKEDSDDGCGNSRMGMFIHRLHVGIVQGDRDVPWT